MRALFKLLVANINLIMVIRKDYFNVMSYLSNNRADSLKILKAA